MRILGTSSFLLPGNLCFLLPDIVFFYVLIRNTSFEVEMFFPLQISITLNGICDWYQEYMRVQTCTRICINNKKSLFLGMNEYSLVSVFATRGRVILLSVCICHQG